MISMLSYKIFCSLYMEISLLLYRFISVFSLYICFFSAGFVVITLFFFHSLIVYSVFHLISLLLLKQTLSSLFLVQLVIYFVLLFSIFSSTAWWLSTHFLHWWPQWACTGGIVWRLWSSTGFTWICRIWHRYLLPLFAYNQKCHCWVGRWHKSPLQTYGLGEMSGAELLLL